MSQRSTRRHAASGAHGADRFAEGKEPAEEIPAEEEREGDPRGDVGEHAKRPAEPDADAGEHGEDQLGPLADHWDLEAAGFEQPEGLASLLNGDLFIASEGDDDDPVLKRFAYQAAP